VRLTELRGRWVVVFFYGKNHSAHCTKALKDFQASVAQLHGQGALVFGIGPGDLEDHQVFADACRVHFPLCVDRDQKVTQKYGALRERGRNGHRWMALVRTCVLIDPSGKVAKVLESSRISGHAEKILATLKTELVS